MCSVVTTSDAGSSSSSGGSSMPVGGCGSLSTACGRLLEDPPDVARVDGPELDADDDDERVVTVVSGVISPGEGTSVEPGGGLWCECE